jgi:transcriptional regulator with XRE-family HTH domain
MDKEFAQKVKQVLKDRGLKQKWLADKTGISEPHLSNILAARVLLTDENRLAINNLLKTTF